MYCSVFKCQLDAKIPLSSSRGDIMGISASLCMRLEFKFSTTPCRIDICLTFLTTKQNKQTPSAGAGMEAYVCNYSIWGWRGGAEAEERRD